MAITDPIVNLLKWILSFFTGIVSRFWNRRFLNDIIFNCAWEDPAVDKQALDLSKDDEILIITSAGCNVLSLLLEGPPNHIYSIDRNPCQNATLNLKLACIKELDFETMWKIWGTGCYPGFKKLYQEKLRRNLTSEAQTFWDGHCDYFESGPLRKSFYYHGTSGLLAFLLCKVYMRIMGIYDDFVKLSECSTIEEQKEMYYGKQQLREKMFNSTLSRLFGNSQTMMLAGVPPPQQELLKEFGGPIPYFRDCFDFLVNNLPFNKNYFYKVYLTGSYTRENCPDYLREENFNKLKKEKLYERVSTHTELISDFLKDNKNHKINRWILLDHMDWMTKDKTPLIEEWELILESTKRPAKFLFRSASKDAKFVKETVVAANGEKKRLDQWITWNDELANRIHQEDRVHTYTSFHVGDLKA